MKGGRCLFAGQLRKAHNPSAEDCRRVVAGGAKLPRVQIAKWLNFKAGEPGNECERGGKRCVAFCEAALCESGDGGTDRALLLPALKGG